MQPSPRNLAFVITELEPGGAERCLAEIVLRLDRSRFTPSVYSLAGEPPTENRQLVERLAASGVNVQFLGLRKATEYPRAVAELAAHFRSSPPALVQSFLFHANVVASRAARAASVARMVTGIRVADPRWWRTALERFATAHADRFVCVSQSVSAFCRLRGFAAEKLVVIPNGVELDRWRTCPPLSPAALGIPATRRLLLFVGRLDRQKGLDGLFPYLPHLFNTLSNYDLALVGSGPERPALQRQVQTAGIAHRVHFLGWRNDVPAILAASDILLLPSRWEGMPNVVLEAMAAGKPIVATQSAGTVELLGLTALDQTVRVGDWEGFADRVQGIAANPILAASLAQKNRLRAAQFSLSTMAERYMRLYESLLTAPK